MYTRCLVMTIATSSLLCPCTVVVLCNGDTLLIRVVAKGVKMRCNGDTRGAKWYDPPERKAFGKLGGTKINSMSRM